MGKKCIFVYPNDWFPECWILCPVTSFGDFAAQLQIANEPLLSQRLKKTPKSLITASALPGRFKEQKTPVPAGASKAAHKFHGAIFNQDLGYFLTHVPIDSKRSEVVKIIPSQFPQSPCSCTIALPWLGFYKQIYTFWGKVAQEFHQATVPMVQVDPHGDRHTEANVKNRAAKPPQVRAQQAFPCLSIHNIESRIGNGVWERATFFSSLNQRCIDVATEKT